MARFSCQWRRERDREHRVTSLTADYDSPRPYAFILHAGRATRSRHKPPSALSASTRRGLDDNALGAGGFRVVTFAWMACPAPGSGKGVKGGERERRAWRAKETSRLRAVEKSGLCALYSAYAGGITGRTRYKRHPDSGSRRRGIVLAGDCTPRATCRNLCRQNRYSVWIQKRGWRWSSSG